MVTCEDFMIEKKRSEIKKKNDARIKSGVAEQLKGTVHIEQNAGERGVSSNLPLRDSWNTEYFWKVSASAMKLLLSRSGWPVKCTVQCAGQNKLATSTKGVLIKASLFIYEKMKGKGQLKANLR